MQSSLKNLHITATYGLFKPALNQNQVLWVEKVLSPFEY